MNTDWSLFPRGPFLSFHPVFSLYPLKSPETTVSLSGSFRLYPSSCLFVDSKNQFLHLDKLSDLVRPRILAYLDIPDCCSTNRNRNLPQSGNFLSGLASILSLLLALRH